MTQPAPIFRIVPFDNLVDSVDQDRIRVAGLDMDHVVRLALSIRGDFGRYPSTLGLYPNDLPLVQANGKGTYILKIGYHRKAACRLLAEGGEVTLASGETVTFEPDGRWAAGLPCILAEHDDNTLAAVGSNIAQKALNPIEQASAAQLLRDQGKGLAEIAAIFGKSESAMSNLMRLLKLPRGIRQLISEGLLTERHGRALLPLVEIPGCLQHYAAQHGEDLWTTKHPHMAGADREFPESASLWIFNVRATENNVRSAIKAHTRRLIQQGNSWDGGITPWPLDWDLASDVPTYLPVAAVTEMPADHHGGPCAACPFAKQLDKDAPYPHCTNVDCHERRGELWTQREINRQRQAIETWCDANGVPLERIHTEKVPYEWREHGTSDAPATLIDDHHCDAEKCECLRVVFKPHAAANATRPDPEGAPDFVLMCSSAQRLANRKRALMKDLDIKNNPDYPMFWYERRRNALRNAINARRKRFVDQVCGHEGTLVEVLGEASADAASPAFASNVAFLQKLDDAVNRPGEWGKPTTETNPKKLWRAILNGVMKKIDESHTDDKRLDELTAFIQALGGQIDEADLAPVIEAGVGELLSDAEELMTDEHLTEYAVERLTEQIDEFGAHLSKADRARVVEALQIALTKPVYTAHDANAIIPTLHGLIGLLTGTEITPEVASNAGESQAAYTHIRRFRQAGNLCTSEGETYITIRAAQIRRRANVDADICPACLTALDGVPE